MASTADRARSTSAPSTTTAGPAPAPTSTGGFQLDGVLDGAKRLGQTGKMMLTSLGQLFLTTVTAAVDAGAPTPGSEIEIAAGVHVPIYDALCLAGNLSIKAQHTQAGTVIAKASGSLGPSLGNMEGAFADLLGSVVVQGEGNDAAQAVEMLSLAIETEVRSISFGMIAPIALPTTPIGISLLALQGVALASGCTIGDLIADAAWGIGHAAAVQKGMKNGQAAQVNVGATIGGESQSGSEEEGNIDVKGAMGINGQERIEKKPGQATTTTGMASFVANGALEFGMSQFTGSAGFSIQLLPSSHGSGAVFTGTLNGKVDVTKVEDVAKYLAALSGALAQASAMLSKAPADYSEAAKKAVAVLDAGQAAIGAAKEMLVSSVILELKHLGLKTLVGLEAYVVLDSSANTVTIKFSYTTEAGENLKHFVEGGVTQKMQLGPLKTIQLAKTQ